MKALFLDDTKKLSIRDTPDAIYSENETINGFEIVSIGVSEYLGYTGPGLRPLPNYNGSWFFWCNTRRTARHC